MTDTTGKDSSATAPTPSWLARYGSIIAIVALLVAVAGVLTEGYAVIGYQLGRVPLRLALTSLLRNGATIAGVGTGLCLVITIAFAALAKKGVRRNALVISATGIVAGAIAFYIPFSVQRGAQGAPPIHDITTDTENPPQFVDAVPLRKATGARNPPEYLRERGRAPNIINVPEAQRKAFPEIQPVILPGVAPAEAFKRARDAVGKLNWHLISAKPEAGRIEAWDQTFWFRFIDDVVIRITPLENGSRIDVRSKSRIGGGDAGTNARRIRNFVAALDKSTKP